MLPKLFSVITVLWKQRWWNV